MKRWCGYLSPVALAMTLASCGAEAPGNDVREPAASSAAAPDGAEKADILSPEELLAAARASGEYLLRQQRGDGSFPLIFESAEERWSGDSEDNHPLQAAICESLFELFEATKEETFHEGGLRCLEPLLAEARQPRREHRGEDFEAFTDGGDPNRGDLGATASVLLASIAEADGSGDRSLLPRLQRQGRFLLFQQDEKGTPTHEYLFGEAESRVVEPLFAPSQAALALIRLSRLDPENGDLWRQGGERYLGWIMAVRDLGKTYDRLPRDPWLVKALEELYEVSGGGRTYFLHARRTSAGILEDLEPAGEFPAASGDLGVARRAFDTARRGEALAAMVRFAARAEADPGEYQRALEECVAFLARCQRQDLPAGADGNGGLVSGGIADGLKDADISTRTVVHSIHAFLGAWRLRADEARRAAREPAKIPSL